MLYLTSRLYSPNQFDVQQDPPLWQELVSKMIRLDESIWKIWTIADVFRAGPSESYVSRFWEGEVGVSAPGSETSHVYPLWRWQQTEIVAQSAASYLQIELAPGQTTFTLASESQSALQSLQALIVNLYEPVTPAGLDAFLERNRDVLVRFVEVFNRETGDKERQTFSYPVNLRSISSKFPPTRFDILNLSIIPQINDPLPVPVLRFQIRAQANQAGFLLVEEKQFLSRPELLQARNLFTLADVTFGIAMPVGVT